MKKVHARRYMIPAAVVAALGLVFWAGCSKDLMSPDKLPPEDSAITNPSDMSSLNEGTINVRGRAEVGATVDVLVKDVLSGIELLQGTAVSSPAVPYDGLGGRFTVEDVSLGDEGTKIIRARITDLYGNVSSDSETPTITVILDLQAPSIAFEGIVGAEWDALGGFWQTGLPEVTVSGSTDRSAAGARLSFGPDELVAESFLKRPSPSYGSESVAWHRSTRYFTIDVPSPPLSGGHADTTITYSLESFDVAGNVNAVPLLIHWEVEGKEEELSHDDGTYDAFDHMLTGRPGQKVAVMYQAPTWANYVTKIIYYIGNDQQTNPENPEWPTTMPFTAWVWRATLDDLPGVAGNAGYNPFPEPWSYPEEEWVWITFPNAIDITDNSHYPDKKFFVGLEWENRNNPYIYEDHASATNEIDFMSFFWDWDSWDRRTEEDTMIRAVVSDVPSLEGKGREAVLVPRISR